MVLRNNREQLPAGKPEPGEAPFAAAKRELKEEPGITAAEWRSPGLFYPTVVCCSGAIHLYLATGLTPSAMHLDGAFPEPYVIPPAGQRHVPGKEIEDPKTSIGCRKAWEILPGA